MTKPKMDHPILNDIYKMADIFNKNIANKEDLNNNELLTFEAKIKDFFVFVSALPKEEIAQYQFDIDQIRGLLARWAEYCDAQHEIISQKIEEQMQYQMAMNAYKGNK